MDNDFLLISKSKKDFIDLNLQGSNYFRWKSSTKIFMFLNFELLNRLFWTDKLKCNV